MKTTGIALLSAASLLAAGTAMAAEPQWNFVELGWVQGDGLDDNGKIEGYQFAGSIGFLNNLHLQASYIDGDRDFTFGDVDFDGFGVTFGYHKPISSSGNTQFVADLSYTDIDVDGGEGGSAYGVGFGLRSVLADRFELEGMVTYSRGDIDNGGPDFTDTGLKLGGRYHWLPSLSTGITLFVNGPAAGSVVQSSDVAVIDVRYSFGSDITRPGSN